MSTSNKENTANLNVSISRRAKKDAKRLALSPMKESSGKSPVSSPGLEENMRPKSDAEKTQHKIKELEGQNNSLHAQLAVSKVTYEQMERKLNEKIQTLEFSLKRVREESQKKYESEHEKVRNLKKEVNRLQKDNETKTQKIERLEEYLQISKDISNNLQTEKKMLEAQIQNEKDMIRRLEALTESARKESEQNESAQYETQVATLTQELTQVRGQLEASEERLFLTTALSIKLNYFNDGIGSQLNSAELFERVKQQNIPRELWGKFIQDTLMTIRPVEESQPLPVTAAKSPSRRGKSSTKNNTNVRTIAKRL